MKRAWGLLFSLSLLALVAGAAGLRAGADPQEMAREVANLSAEQWRDRRDAMQWLVDAGPAAELPLRRLIDRTRNPEARMLAQRVLDRISQIRRIEPAIVDLNLHYVDGRTAFQQVADLEGAELPIDSPDLLADVSGTVTVQYARQTYWETMLDLCRRTGLQVRFGPAGAILTRRSAETASDAVACSGIFLISAQLTRWSPDPADLGRSVRLELHAEPKAEVLQGNWRVKLTEASDEHGRSLVPLAESGINMGGAQKLADGLAWFVPLRAVSSARSRVRRFRGSVSVLLAASVASGQTPDHAGDRTLAGPFPVNLSCGAVSASILRITPDGSSWTMEMQVDSDPSEVDWDAVMQAMGSGGLRAFDADGHELTLKNFWRAGGGPSNQVRCKWGKSPDASEGAPGEPFKLIWRIPSKTVQLTVPFDLTDVRLP